MVKTPRRKKQQPSRMDRYANLGEVKHTPKKRPRQHKHFQWFWNLSRKKKILVCLIPVVILLIAIPLITYFIYAQDISDRERLMNRNNTGIVLTDVNGKTFYSVGRAEHRNLVPLDQISDNMKHALIASEDKDFYKHGGFNIFSIFRAAITRHGGGSTITQQLVKNTLLTDEKSYLRKYQELFMAIAVEQNYTKDEILTMYLNSVFYGENAFGIEEAAKTYFGKEPKDLDLAESAMLVGLLPAPSAYSPISGNATYAKQRQETVLSRMVTNEFITKEQKESALNEELHYASSADTINSVAPHFAEMVIKQLSDKYGYEKVMRSGYQVKTTLDLTTQQTLVDSINRQMSYINQMGGSNASGIIMDPTTGQVRALVGSADYNNKDWGKVNMATTARQPGSSFKPIYYSYALADGAITASTMYNDKLTDFGGGYTPYNADRRWHGMVSTRKALNWSLNIPSVLVMQKYGISKSVQAAKNLGITTIDESKNYGLSLALGSAEVPLVQMTNAYAAFANGGQQYDPIYVTEVKDKFDNKIDWQTEASKQAISRGGAYLISSILSDNAARAGIFGSSLTVSGHTVAVKTGTTNDNRDAWTIGYNPEYVVGVWVGNNDNASMKSGGSDMAGPIWRNTMTKLLAGRTNVNFSIPDGIVQRDVCSSNGGLATNANAGVYKEYFLAGALPTIQCNTVRTKIPVCNLSDKKMESIYEDDFDATKYSKNEADCKTKQISVCDIATQQVVTIDEDAYDSTKYSKDTANCAAKDDDDADDNSSSTDTNGSSTNGGANTRTITP